jgi:hypothetical protein
MAIFILLMLGLGLALGYFALWATFWAVLFVVEFVKFGHRDLAYRRAEKHHPGIYARLQRTLDLREAEWKRKEAHDKWSAKMMASIYRREQEASYHRTAAAWAALGSS